jgi:scavenger receptor class B, member 1
VFICHAYREWKERHDIVDDSFKDTVSYSLRNRFVFRPDLSNGLTGGESVTMPNLILLGGLMAVKRDRAPMIPLVAKAMKSIFNDPESPFIATNVMDILFNGVDFNCDGDDFSAKAVCEAIKAEGPEKGVIVHNETFISFSILGGVSGKNIYLPIKNRLYSTFIDKKNSKPILDPCRIKKDKPAARG